jgi:hypothetical protein
MPRVRIIEHNAFADARVDESHLPPSIESVDGSAFIRSIGDRFPTLIISESQIPTYSDGFLLNKHSGRLFRYIRFNNVIVIGRLIEVIGNCYFWSCACPARVSFEAGSRLKAIGRSAFNGSHLDTIRVPGSVEVLGPSSFQWCTKLVEVTFDVHSQLQRIRNAAFSDSALSTITIDVPCASRVLLDNPGCELVIGES